jgi:hypothetical protein
LKDGIRGIDEEGGGSLAGEPGNDIESVLVQELDSVADGGDGENTLGEGLGVPPRSDSAIVFAVLYQTGTGGEDAPALDAIANSAGVGGPDAAGSRRMKTIDRVLLGEWIKDALQERGGTGSLLDVAKAVWKAHGAEIEEGGDIFYTWQYELRWAAKLLRDDKVL